MTGLCPKLNNFTQNPIIVTAANQYELRMDNYARTPGTQTTVRCVDGIHLHGPSQLTCQTNLQWSGVSSCKGTPVPTDPGLTQEQLIIIGVSVGVGVILLILMIILIVCFRRREKQTTRYRESDNDTDAAGWPYTHTWVSRTSGLSPGPNSIAMAAKPHPWRERPSTYYHSKGFSSVEDEAPPFPRVHHFERYDSSLRNPSYEERVEYNTFPPRPTDASIHRKRTENEWEELEDFYGGNFSETASRRTPSRSMHEYVPWQLQFDNFDRSSSNHWIPRPKTSPRPNRYF